VTAVAFASVVGVVAVAAAAAADGALGEEYVGAVAVVCAVVFFCTDVACAAAPVVLAVCSFAPQSLAT